MGQALDFNPTEKEGFSSCWLMLFCGKEVEPEHILIRCSQIWGQWTVLSAFAIYWVAPSQLKILLLAGCTFQ